MNVDDVTEVEKVYDHLVIDAIFEKQKTLMEKYDPIEEKNGANVPHPPYRIDDVKVQARVKDLAWRITEEISEAIEFEEDLDFSNWKNRWKDDHEIRHFFEEMADALHFLTELSIVTDLDMVIITDTYDQLVVNGNVEDCSKSGPNHLALRIWCMGVIRKLGLACNCLKNKYWKNTHMATDDEKFKDLLYGVWREYLLLMANLGVGPQELYSLYFKKNQVNQFRIRSNY